MAQIIPQKIDIIYCDGGKAEDHQEYPGFKQESKVLKQGSVLKQGALALPCDILWERDVAVQLRDGTTIYVDIYRPPLPSDQQIEASLKVPVIVSAGPFGKNGGYNRAAFDKLPFRMGVPQCTVSSLEKFEGPDPAYWCLHGYAIAHPGQWIFRDAGDLRSQHLTALVQTFVGLGCLKAMLISIVA